jgi:hypothetical protein
MNRRKFLAAAGVTALVGPAGCVGSSGGDSSDRPWMASEPTDDPGGVHDLFVENHTDTTETAWIRVVHEDGATLVDGRYELPDGRAIEFEDVAAWETTYTVDVAVDGEDTATYEWYPEECGAAMESPNNSGSRNAAVRVEADGSGGLKFDFRMDECDAIHVGTIPSGPAEGFRVDE